MSCSNHFPGHFVIIDTGHPTTNDTILLIKRSLQGVLSLSCNMRDISRIPVFGYGVLAPSFQIIQQWKMLSGNFPTFDNNLEYLVNPSNIGAKVTLRDYRSFLENSIENIVTDFDNHAKEWKAVTDIREKFNPLHYWPSQIQITLITRKGGFVLVEILKKFQNYSSKLQRIEIVEISSCEDKSLSRNDLNFISHSVIKESVYDLDTIFKRWFSGDHSQREQLQITLNRTTGIHIMCDVSECLINPATTTLPNILLSAPTTTFITQKPFHTPVSKPSIHEMEVVNKIGITDVCQSAFFGFPKWIYPTRTCTTNWDEFRYNAEIFRALCAQLYTAEIGLLSRLKPSSSFNKLTPLYFIVSDGRRLLMKNVVPVELRLPPSPEVMAPQTDIEEEANIVVRSFIDQMKIETFSPESQPTGIYEHFRERLISELKKTEATTLKPGIEPVYKAKRSRIPPRPDMPPGEYIPKFLLERKSPVETTCVIGSRKTRKRKDEPIHPALMSPDTMAKYRKRNSTHYQLPEVLEPGVLEK